MPDFISNVLGRTEPYAPPVATTSNPTPAANSAPSPLPPVENRSPAKTTAPKPAATPVLPAIGDGDETATVTHRPTLSESDRLKAFRVSQQAEQESLELKAFEARESLLALNRKIQEENLRRETEKRERIAAAQAEELRRQEAERTRPRTWEERFADKAYSGESVPITATFLEMLITTGKLEKVVAEKAAAIAPFDAVWNEALNKVAAAREEIVVKQARNILTENFAAAQRNELEKIRPIPNHSQLEEQFAAERIVFRQVMKTQTALALPIVGELASVLQEAVRDLASTKDAEERAFATRINLDFRPSYALQALVASGFELSSRLMIGHSTSRPFDFFAGILQKRVPAQPAKT